MVQCGFKTAIHYRDEKTGEYIPYVCPEDIEEYILDSGLCIFHDGDPKIKEAHKQTIQKELTKKIEDSKLLICIGYCLPDISFEESHFDKSVNFSGAVFMGLINFSNAQFKEANFSETEFTRANFHGAQFTQKANFFKAKFTKEANFSETKFKEADFLMAEFTKACFSLAQFTRADFAGARFTGEANFIEAQFKEANFIEAQFKEVNFFKAQFITVRFSQAQFIKASFSEAQFSEAAVFHDARFTDQAYFAGARFTGEANFIETQFIQQAAFSKTQFAEKVSFYGAQFAYIADFPNAQFSKEAVFYEAQFNDEANFSGARFTSEAYFSSKFTDANFLRTQFADKANFHEAQFTKLADFSETYVKDATFTKAHFREAFFYKTQFADKADFSEIVSTTKKDNPQMDFHNVQFDIPEHITFLKANLSEVSFVNTDITRVRFGEDVMWGDKFKVREEREIEDQLKTKNSATDIQLGDVLAVYRNLRENYEFRMRYDEAGEFFVREMEMKRSYQTLNSRSRKNILRLKWWIKEISSLEEKNKVGLGQNDWISRNISLTGLYYHLSKYGQSFFRPTIFGIGIVLFSTLLWSIQPNAAGEFLVYNMNFSQVVNSSNLEVAFGRSLTNFLPSLSFGTPLNVGLLDVAFKIVGGAVTFGLIIIALRRKFERKFRH